MKVAEEACSDKDTTALIGCFLDKFGSVRQFPNSRIGFVYDAVFLLISVSEELGTKALQTPNPKLIRQLLHDVH
jgi:hypothetical protein